MIRIIYLAAVCFVRKLGTDLSVNDFNFLRLLSCVLHLFGGFLSVEEIFVIVISFKMIYDDFIQCKKTGIIITFDVFIVGKSAVLIFQKSCYFLHFQRFSSVLDSDSSITGKKMCLCPEKLITFCRWNELYICVLDIFITKLGFVSTWAHRVLSACVISSQYYNNWISVWFECLIISFSLVRTIFRK